MIRIQNKRFKKNSWEKRKSKKDNKLLAKYEKKKREKKTAWVLLISGQVSEKKRNKIKNQIKRRIKKAFLHFKIIYRVPKTFDVIYWWEESVSHHHYSWVSIQGHLWIQSNNEKLSNSLVRQYCTWLLQTRGSNSI